MKHPGLGCVIFPSVGFCKKSECCGLLPQIREQPHGSCIRKNDGVFTVSGKPQKTHIQDGCDKTACDYYQPANLHRRHIPNKRDTNDLQEIFCHKRTYPTLPVLEPEGVFSSVHRAKETEPGD